MKALLALFQQPFAQALGWTLLHFLWQGAVLAALLGVVLGALRKSPAHTRYLAACLALSLMALAPIVTFNQVSHQRELRPTITGVIFSDVQETFLVAPALRPPERSPSPEILPDTLRSKLEGFSRQLEVALPWLVAVWLGVVSVLSLRLFAGWLCVRRLRNNASELLNALCEEQLSRLVRELKVSRPVRLFKSVLVEVPTVVGWLRPVILVPATVLTNLTPAQLEAILAHELAHIRRHDYLVNLLQKVVETFLFYHPAIWWVSRQIDQERENCCDDLTVAVCGDRIAYAKTLATLEELRSAPRQLRLAASGGSLLQRIRRLLDLPTEANGSGWWLAGAIALLTIVTFIAAGRNVVLAQESKATTAGSGAMTAETAHPFARTNIIASSSKRQAILQKLDTIILDEAFYDGIPLSNVVKQLDQEVQRRDPDKRRMRMNFIISSRGVPTPPRQSNDVDQATGQQLSLPAPPKPVYCEEVIIRINPALRNVRLADLLDAIIQSADQPLKYSVEDYAVVFSQKTDEPPPLFTRTFKVDPGTIRRNLAPSEDDPSTATGLQKALRDYFQKAGVDFPAPPIRQQGDDRPASPSRKAAFFNERTGIIFVRATLAELDLIEKAIQVLNTAPPQVRLEVKVVDLSDADAKALGLDWFLGNVFAAGEKNELAASLRAAPSLSPPPPSGSNVVPQTVPQATNGTPAATLTPILDDAQFRHLLRLLESRTGADVPSPPPSGSNAVPGTVPQTTNRIAAATATGILTDAQLRLLLRSLESRSGVDVLSLPAVTTLSSRQARIAVTEAKTIVFPKHAGEQATGGGSTTKIKAEDAFETKQVPLGPSVDIIPFVSADGSSIRMTIMPTFVEFLGYDDPGKGKPIVPLPRFRLRQTVASVTVADRQTVVLGGVPDLAATELKDKVPVRADVPLLGRFFRSESTNAVRKNLILFVTPTIVDPAGNPVHPLKP
ncbi:MAG: M56 family metallopeptidase [Verrucomicrobiota bacterium]|mgnify:CR=1 FL=1